MILVIALAIINSHLVADPIVDVEAIGPIKSLVARITQQTGEKIVIDSELENQVFYLKVRQQPLSAVKEILSNSLMATWELKESGIWKLARTTKQRMEVRKEATLLRSSKIEFALKDLKRYALEGDPKSVAFSYVQKLNDDLKLSESRLPRFIGPPHDLCLDFAKLMGPNELAEVAYLRSNFYSNMPTFAEKWLPTKFNELTRNFTAIQREFQELATSEGSNNWPAVIKNRLVPKNVEALPHRFLFSVGNFDKEVPIGVTIYDHAGMQICTASTRIPIASSLGQTSKEVASIVGSDSELNESRRIRSLSNAILTGEGFIEWLERLSKPDVEDPLQIALADNCHSLAEREKLSAFIALPDSLIDLLSEKSLPSNREFTTKLEKAGINLVQENRWLVGKPVDFESFGRANLPRKALRDFLLEIQTKDQALFRSLFKLYSVAGDSIFGSPMLKWYRQILTRRKIVDIPHLEISYHLARFLGSLSSNEWQRLEEGHSIPISNVKNARAWFHQLSFGARQLSLSEGVTQFSDMYLSGTVSFPTAIPIDSFVSLSKSPRKTMRGAELTDGGWAPFSAIADVFAARLQAEPQITINDILQESYELAEQNEYRFEIKYLPELVRVETQTHGTQVFNLKPPLKYSDWSEADKQALNNEIQRAIRTRGSFVPFSPPPIQ